MKRPRQAVKVPGPRPLKRRRSAFSRVLLLTSLLVLLAGVAAGAGLFYAQLQFAAPGPLTQDKVVIIEPGQSASGIGAALEREGVISNAQVFAVMSQLTGQRTRLKAGEYAFPAAATMRDVMALIASGKSVTYKISIPEGFTSEMAAARINANEVLAGPPVAAPPEGSILPDTYVFRRGTTRQKMLSDMQAAQAELLDELWAKRIPVSVITSPAQAVTLASIVEKETAVAKERPLIAAVFINRLKKGMRLQSDPTIIYGIAAGKGRLDRALTRADIEAETPYNTYRIKGLPPGPIANPGRASLEAVLNPTDTEHLYFVADGSGGHAFASSLAEHNRNVRTWRKIAGNAAAAAAAESGTGDEPADAPPPAAAASAAPAAPAIPSPAADAPPGLSAGAPLADVAPEPADSPADAAAMAADDPTVPAETGDDPPPAKPAVKPAAKAAAKPVAKRAAPKPGSIVIVDGRPVVIPRLRPPR